MFQKPPATNVPVVAPLCAVLMHGVSDSSEEGVDVTVEPQNPFPQPPLLGVVLLNSCQLLLMLSENKSTCPLAVVLSPMSTKEVGTDTRLAATETKNHARNTIITAIFVLFLHFSVLLLYRVLAASRVIHAGPPLSKSRTARIAQDSPRPCSAAK